VSIDTLRYYERLKLLPRASRSSGGFRLFDDDIIERVLFIKQAQELGFSLDEIKGLLATGGAAECRRVRDLLKTKIDELDTKLRAMKEFRRTLASHLSACERELRMRGQDACCPIVLASKQRRYRK
jgi:MerR family mercuric resistance operon transcriptional regulator